MLMRASSQSYSLWFLPNDAPALAEVLPDHKVEREARNLHILILNFEAKVDGNEYNFGGKYKELILVCCRLVMYGRRSSLVGPLPVPNICWRRSADQFDTYIFGKQIIVKAARSSFERWPILYQKVMIDTGHRLCTSFSTRPIRLSRYTH